MKFSKAPDKLSYAQSKKFIGAAFPEFLPAESMCSVLACSGRTCPYSCMQRTSRHSRLLMRCEHTDVGARGFSPTDSVMHAQINTHSHTHTDTTHTHTTQHTNTNTRTHKHTNAYAKSMCKRKGSTTLLRMHSHTSEFTLYTLEILRSSAAPAPHDAAASRALLLPYHWEAPVMLEVVGARTHTHAYVHAGDRRQRWQTGQVWQVRAARSQSAAQKQENETWARTLGRPAPQQLPAQLCMARFRPAASAFFPSSRKFVQKLSWKDFFLFPLKKNRKRQVAKVQIWFFC